MCNDRTRSLVRTLALAAFALAASAAFAAPRSPVAATTEGPVRGVLSAGIDRYKGIPYAAAPVGNLRWQPPRPHGRWQGVRDAAAFANHCPQTATPYGQATSTEDCLYLNVYTPARGTDALPEDALLPVMVWIHGGALIVGESDDYDPVRLVQQGVVVVTINYRLGVLGFFAHPALSAESGHATDNYGLMDQQAALHWVQRNISHFGGDPGRVTIFGESAGGLSVHSHLASPLSSGLFHGAIVQSGAYALAQPSVATAEAAGKKVAADRTFGVGCGEDASAATAACLRAASVDALLAARNATGPTSVVPDVDGTVLKESIGDAFAAGRFNTVPVIEGSNHDEWRLFVGQAEAQTGRPVTAAGYVQGIMNSLGVPLGTATFFASLYPAAAYPSPSIALGALGTDLVFACNARKTVKALAHFVPTYAYEFADENAPELFLPPVSFPYGSAHASEIQYLLDLRSPLPPGLVVPLNATQRELSAAMVTHWTNFARTGSPGNGWSAYSDASDQVQSLVPPAPIPTTETAFGTAHRCAVWTPGI